MTRSRTLRSIAGLRRFFRSKRHDRGLQPMRRYVLTCEALEDRCLLAILTSVASGTWSSGSTWNTGTAPATGDQVTVATGHTVTYNATDPDTIGKITISGKLGFTASSTLTLTTNANIVVTGELEMRPSSAAVTHTVTFTGINEANFVGGGDVVLDSDVGLWVTAAGILDTIGTTKTPWTRLTGSANAGATVITVQNASGWRVGDNLQIVPTQAPTVGDPSWNGYDSRTISAINGNQVTLSSALSFNHPMVNGQWTAEVLNVTRNVIIEGTPTGRAHVAIMLATQPQTIQNVEIRHVGPQQGGNSVLGRYGMHIHHNDDASRGSLIENVVVHDAGGHAYVPHDSHGITFRGTISHNTADAAYWWDPGAGNETDDTVWDQAVASMVKITTSNKFAGVTGFFLGSGANNTLSNSVAVGVQGTSTSSGINWPESSNQDPFNVWNFSTNNISHNNRTNGVYVWQNDFHSHVIENFVVYHNGKSGIEHGAYNNNYAYRNVTFYGDGQASLILHAQPGASGMAQRFDNMLFDGADITPYGINVVFHNGSAVQPTLVTNSTFQNLTNTGVAFTYTGDPAVNTPENMIFVDNTFEAGLNQWSLSNNIRPESLITVEETNGTRYELRRFDQSGTLVPAWNARRTDLPAYVPPPAYSGFTASDSFTGANGSAWSSGWTVTPGGTSVTIQANEGEIKFGTGGGPGIAVRNAANAVNADSLQVVKLRASQGTSGMTGGLIARRADSNPNSYYLARLNSSSSGLKVNVVRVINGTSYSLPNGDVPLPTWAVNTNYWLKLQVLQQDAYTTEVSLKFWQDGQSEPSGWTLQALDTARQLQNVVGRQGIYAIAPVSAGRFWRFDEYSALNPSPNTAPVVNAGNDQTITLPGSAALDGTVSDDGLPNPPGAVTVTWSKVSGPGTVNFGNANAVDTTASFSTSGVYVLQLLANDSALNSSDTVTVTVNPAGIAETWTAANGSAWPSQWTRQNISGTAPTTDIQSNEGRVLVAAGGATGQVLMYVNTATAKDVDQTVQIRVNNNSAYPGIIARRADGDSDTYYDARIGSGAGSNPQLTIRKIVDGVVTNIGQVAQTITSNTNYKLRFQVVTNGSTTDLRARYWLATNPEPSTWNLQVLGNTEPRLQGISGRFGLKASVNLSNREARFDNYSATVLQALMAAGGEAVSSQALALEEQQLQPLVRAAIAFWEAQGEDVSGLAGVNVQIADLGGALLGLAADNTLLIDTNAAGHGWFVDATPWEDSEFADGAEPAGIDLFSALAHELGHLLGHEHEEAGAMFETLAAGVRTASIQDQLFASSNSAGEETDQFADLIAAVAFQEGKRATNFGLWTHY